MANLTIVAHITANDEQVELVQTELQKLIEPTRAEEGCVQYDLHQDNKNPAHFMFFENWDSYELWQAHSNNQHLKEFLAATEGAIAEFSVHEMTLIG